MTYRLQGVGAVKGVIEDQAPPSTYAVAALIDGQRGAILRTVGLTALRSVFIAPGLWVAGKAMKIDGLRGWRLLGAALLASSGITLGMLLWYTVFNKVGVPQRNGN